MIDFTQFYQYIALSLVEAYQVISKFAFEYSAECLKDQPQSWYTFDGQDEITSCYNLCHERDDSSKYPAFLMVSNREVDIGLKHTVSLQNLKEDYSQIGIDLIFFSSSQDIKVTINTNEAVLTTNSETSFESTNIFNCPTEIHFAKASFVVHSNIKTNQLVAYFQKTVKDDRFGIRSLIIWSQCVQNCLECVSADSCSKCFKGFEQVTLSDGKIACEQYQECSLTFPYCEKCVIAPNNDKCLKCQPGYRLLPTGQCENVNSGAPCVSQYYDKQLQQCVSYSSSCYYQIRGSNKFEECKAGSVQTAEYKCNKNQMIIIYDKNNYNLSKCGCLISFCKNCLNLTDCIDCNDGYYYDSEKKKCKPECQSNQYYEESSNKCINCGNNCLKCNSQQCLQCTNDSFQVHSSQKQNCIECTINKCQKCFDTNKCQTCNTGYKVFEQIDFTCRLECDVDNCQDCNQGNNKKCNTCKQGYESSIDQSKCIQQCILSNCDECNQNNMQQCKICKNDYYLNPNSFNCEKCSVQNCKQCDNNSSLKCKECNSGYYVTNYLCSSNYQEQKEKEEKIHLDLKQQLDRSGYIIEIYPNITFDYIPSKTNSLIDIKISNVDKFYFNITEIEKDHLKLKITVDQNVKEQKLTLQILDEQFIQANKVSNKKLEKNLDTFVIIDQQTQDQIDKIKAVSENAGHTIITTFIPALIFGNFYILINMIDMTGFLYYLLYVNIRLPKNVIEFFELFQNFQFPFIPNLFEKIIPQNYVQTSPKKFMEMNTDCYFIKNAGQSMTIISIIIMLYFLAKALSRLKIKYLQDYLKRAIQNTWEYSAFYDLLGVVYLYVLVGVLVQLYVFDFSDENTYLLNYILHTIFTIVSILVPFGLIYILYKQKNLKDDHKMQKMLSSLIGGLKLSNVSSQQTAPDQSSSLSENNLKKQSTKAKQIEKNNENNQDNFQSINIQSNNYIASMTSIDDMLLQKKTRRAKYSFKLSKYLNGFLYVRKLIYCSLIVFLHNYTVLQLCLISSLNIVCSFFYFYILPHQRYSENIKNGICELLLLSIQIIGSTLIDDDSQQDEDERIKIGWIIVIISAVILLWNFAVMMFDLAKELFMFIKAKCFKQKQNPKPKIQTEKIASYDDLTKQCSDKNIQSLRMIRDQEDQTPNNKNEQTTDDKKLRQNSTQFLQNFASITNISKSKRKRVRAIFNNRKISNQDVETVDITNDIESNPPTYRPSLVDPESFLKLNSQRVEVKPKQRKSKYFQQQTVEQLVNQLQINYIE